jgi:simple sugar transport system permease protein
MMQNSRSRKLADLFGNAAGVALTILISFAGVILLIFLLSDDAGRTIYYFFIGPFTNSYYFGNMINRAIPLIFTGLGIALAFKASVFNLGGEGQVFSGALTATVFLLWLPGLPGIVGKIGALAAAVAVGAFLAGVSGFFRTKWGVDELITSFLISQAVVLIINYFITGPLDDPTNSLLATPPVAERFRLLLIYPPSKLDITIVWAVLVAALAFLFVQRTHWGYEMKICGLNREFARYGGINVSTYLVVPMVLSGAFHGLAGGVSILGTHYRALKGVTAGLGWNGIAVALIAKNNPLAVIPAALFFAYLDAGAKAAMLHSDVTFEIAAIAQAIIFFLVTAGAVYKIFSGGRRKIGGPRS